MININTDKYKNFLRYIQYQSIITLLILELKLDVSSSNSLINHYTQRNNSEWKLTTYTSNILYYIYILLFLIYFSIDDMIS